MAPAHRTDASSRRPSLSETRHPRRVVAASTEVAKVKRPRPQPVAKSIRRRQLSAARQGSREARLTAVAMRAPTGRLSTCNSPTSTANHRGRLVASLVWGAHHAGRCARDCRCRQVRARWRSDAIRGAPPDSRQACMGRRSGGLRLSDTLWRVSHRLERRAVHEDRPGRRQAARRAVAAVVATAVVTRFQGSVRRRLCFRRARR